MAASASGGITSFLISPSGTCTPHPEAAAGGGESPGIPPHALAGLNR